MDLNQVPPTDVRPLLTRDRVDPLGLLPTLSPQQWNAASEAQGWNVKGLALHLLDDDLGLLSRQRDHDHSNLLAMDDHETLVTALATKNERWINGAAGLSTRVVTELLAWSGEQLDEHYADVDLLGEGSVSWASDAPVPMWLDMARELTERWVPKCRYARLSAR
ncbi:MAG: maleylpyruvate isomerase N-terminal domain-containing protein [Actinomycetota bacterium]|nr:maleylpyruvate isomerase N-terminal domain-containing protein [Actinomycetota bacterium]